MPLPVIVFLHLKIVRVSLEERAAGCLTRNCLSAVVVALAEAAYTRSQLPESTSGRPNVLLVALGAAAVTAVCPLTPACE